LPIGGGRNINDLRGRIAMSGDAGGRAVEVSSAEGWKWVSFEFQGEPGSQVFVGGTFNQWRPSRFDQLRDRNRDGTYRTLLKLRKGPHEYGFRVDGEWRSGPEGPVRCNV
jgi:Glycogen recognition site of AMP-activated protein kinase